MRPQGWECPKCNRSWAPHVGACAPCNQMNQFFAPLRMAVRMSQPVNWNFTADDLSYKDSQGDPA